MANFSWISIPLCFFVSMMLGTGAIGHPSKESVQGNAIVIGFIILTGVLCGIIALCGIPKYGAKGLLWPALTGILLWLGLGTLGFLSIPALRLIQKRAAAAHAAKAHKMDLAPVVHTPGAERLQDAEFAFSFDVPPGYRPVPAASKPAQYRYFYMKPDNGELRSIILVSLSGGTQWAGQHLDPARVPLDKRSAMISFSWRGLVVDGSRIREKAPQGDYLTFNVQIPLKKRTVQISFCGPATKEAELHALAIQTLATFEGEPNWP